MAKLRAVLLAAGRGLRMGGQVPKALIEVGDHGTLLEHALAAIKAASITDLMVITGFEPARLQEAIEQRWDGEVTFSRNVRYASWGNFHSVRIAIDQSPGYDLVVINNDIVIAPAVLQRVIDTEGELVLAVERRLRLDMEDMRVSLEGNRVRGISKDLPRGRSHGEYCGVSVLRDAALRIYQDIATDFEWTADTHRYYEDVYARMLNRVVARAAPVNTGEYAEVDVPADLAMAEAVLARLAQPQPS